METTRICLWSGPRNVSTALMYSFAQRADARVLDEPLYAHYLRVTGLEHPGREVVLAGQDADGERVLRDVMLGPCDRPVLFMKQMAHHLIELDTAFLARTVNVLLVREPGAMLASLARVLPEPRLADTGLDAQTRLCEHLRGLGQDPPVLDAELVLRDPPGALGRLCERIGIEFDEAMLSWPAGPRPEDGAWAHLWYAGVHGSTGFAPYRPPEERVPAHLEPLLSRCREHYAPLRAAAEALVA